MTTFRQTPLPFIVSPVILDLHAICDETRSVWVRLHGPWARATKPREHSHGVRCSPWCDAYPVYKASATGNARTTTRWEISLEKRRDWFLAFFEELFETPRFDRTCGKRYHFHHWSNIAFGKTRLSITNTFNHLASLLKTYGCTC